MFSPPMTTKKNRLRCLRVVGLGGSQALGEPGMDCERRGWNMGALKRAEDLECGPLQEQSALQGSDSVPGLARPAMLAVPACLGWLVRLGAGRGADNVLEPSSCRSNRSWLRGR
jgi:hypothetical protein